MIKSKRPSKKNHLYLGVNFLIQVQRLYLKYFRSESFRKALIYQKRYLGMLLNSEKKSATPDAPKTNSATRSLKGVVLMVIAIGRMKHLVQKYQRQLYKSSPEYPYKEKIKNISKKLNLEPMSSETKEKTDGMKPHKEDVAKTVLTSIANKASSKPRQSNLASVSLRLATSEPSINRLHLNNRSLERSIDWLSQTDIALGTQHGGSSLNRSLNEQHLRRPSTSPVKHASSYTGIPRSYPRSPCIVDEFPSKLSSLNNQHASAKSSRAPQSTSSPLKPRDPPVDKDNNLTNESLSNYIEGLEALHNRLKTVGYGDEMKPTLLRLFAG